MASECIEAQSGEIAVVESFFGEDAVVSNALPIRFTVKLKNEQNCECRPVTCPLSPRSGPLCSVRVAAPISRSPPAYHRQVRRHEGTICRGDPSVGVLDRGLGVSASLTEPF